MVTLRSRERQGWSRYLRFLGVVREADVDYEAAQVCVCVRARAGGGGGAVAGE